MDYFGAKKAVPCNFCRRVCSEVQHRNTVHMQVIDCGTVSFAVYIGWSWWLNLCWFLFCRSFLFIEKDQDCKTLPANSKIESLLRRTSSALYEKSGKCLERWLIRWSHIKTKQTNKKQVNVASSGLEFFFPILRTNYVLLSDEFKRLNISLKNKPLLSLICDL